MTAPFRAGRRSKPRGCSIYRRANPLLRGQRGGCCSAASFRADDL